MKNFEFVKGQILQSLNHNRVHLECIDNKDKDMGTSLSELTRKIKCSDRSVDSIAKDLKEVDSARAQRIISMILNKSLAYSVEIMNKDDSDRLAGEFVSSFDEKSRFFTNVLSEEYLSNWMPITSSTFDVGVFVVGTSNSGFILVEDED